MTIKELIARLENIYEKRGNLYVGYEYNNFEGAMEVNHVYLIEESDDVSYVCVCLSNDVNPHQKNLNRNCFFYKRMNL